ncbi:MAG: hypothetical protein INR66_16780 [Gordonia polyisoprenivorans]|nr:hypothetical protein [Gordonia polyisoprenivorans]
MVDGVGASWLPSTWVEFGKALTRFRGDLSYRALAARQDDDRTRFRYALSSSQLQRYESGRPVLLKHAMHLDNLYDGRGWIEMAVRTLWRSDWDPWALDNALLARRHSTGWPAEFSGTVWVKIRPAVQSIDTLHHIDFEWSAWRRSVEIVIPKNGVLISTGKMVDRDGLSRTCNVDADKRIFLLYGAGEDFDDEAVIVDIRRGWRIAPGESPD